MLSKRTLPHRDVGDIDDGVMDEYAHSDDCDDGPNDISSVANAVSGNTTVMLNGTVFSLTSLSSDGDKGDFNGDIRLETGNSNSELVSENGIIVDTSRGLVLSVSDSVAASYGIPLSVISGTADLQGAAHLLSTGDGNQAQHVFQIGGHLVSKSVCSSLLNTNQGDNSSSGDENKAKRRGGWPKGKKRKPDKNGIKPPKAPATGYVLFALGRRAELKVEHPGLNFAEITKLLGHEWSNLPSPEKKQFLEQAEADKQRYADQLRMYQSTEAYQSYIRQKKLRALPDGDPCSIGSNDDDTTVYTDIDDDEMYCKLCDQYFSSLHNKKEHIYGKQHLQNLTGIFEKELNKDIAENSTNNSNSSLGSPGITSEQSSNKAVTTDSDIESFVQNFVERNYDRDLEISELQQAMLKSRERNAQLLNKVSLLKEMETKLEQDIANLKTYNAALATQIDTLRMVPTLFGVINF